ncbi:MAG: hypothetical protein C4526_10700 [Nitrospiraceae bacterium]|nr:MAG: hypothetical protein C4526_10700 [Nitrospiraceae bacterium]
MTIKKYKENKFNYLNCLILLIFTFIMQSCAGVSTQATFPEPGQKFISSEEKSLMIGQFEVLNDNHPLPLNPSSLMIFPLVPYLNNEAELGQQYIIDIDENAGYFVAALPPGKYAVDRISYRVNVPSLKNFSNMLRNVCAGCDFTYRGGILRYPAAIIPVFEVLPGEATYIGILQAITDPYLKLDRWEVNSKLENAREVFSTLYPNHPGPVEKLMEIRPCKEEMSAVKIFVLFQPCRK